MSTLIIWGLIELLKSEGLNHTPDMSVILSTESRWSHAQVEYTCVHNNNLRITPAFKCFLASLFKHVLDWCYKRVVTYKHASVLHSDVRSPWSRGKNNAHVQSVSSLIYGPRISRAKEKEGSHFFSPLVAFYKYTYQIWWSCKVLASDLSTHLIWWADYSLDGQKLRNLTDVMWYLKKKRH